MLTEPFLIHLLFVSTRSLSSTNVQYSISRKPLLQRNLYHHLGKSKNNLRVELPEARRMMAAVSLDGGGNDFL
jgi:hypothetical protein